MIINGSNMLDRQSAHAELARALSLPEHYGANLDALWDCVSEMQNETIVLADSAAMLNNLKDYGCKLLCVFFDAESEGFITLTLQ